MRLEVWQEGLKKIIDHIIQLKQDGDFLVGRGSYNHAYLCSHKYASIKDEIQ